MVKQQNSCPVFDNSDFLFCWWLVCCFDRMITFCVKSIVCSVWMAACCATGHLCCLGGNKTNVRSFHVVLAPLTWPLRVRKKSVSQSTLRGILSCLELFVGHKYRLESLSFYDWRFWSEDNVLHWICWTKTPNKNLFIRS